MASVLMYSKKIPVHLEIPGNRSQRVELLFTLEVKNTGNKELLLRLSDDDNYFFLYSASINQQQYASIKEMQNLFIDFGDFPQYVITLLNRCRGEDKAKNNNKYIMSFSVSEDCKPVKCINSRETKYFLERSVDHHDSHLNNHFSDHSDSKYVSNNNNDNGIDCMSNQNFVFPNINKLFPNGNNENRNTNYSNSHSARDDCGSDNTKEVCSDNDKNISSTISKESTNKVYVNKDFSNSNNSNSTEQTQGKGQLTVVKVKKEKPFIHLALLLEQGTDVDITRHMLAELASYKRSTFTYKSKYENLLSSTGQREDGLSMKLRDTELQLNHSKGEMEEERMKWEAQMEGLKEKHEEESAGLERECRREMQESHEESSCSISDLNKKHQSLQKQLLDFKKTSSQQQERWEHDKTDFKEELGKKEEVSRRLHEELSSLQEEVSIARECVVDKEKEVAEVGKLLSLQKARTDKEMETVSLTTQQLNFEQADNQRLQNEVDKRCKEVTKATAAVKKLVAEVGKGAEVIGKMKEDREKLQLESELVGAVKDKEVGEREKEVTELKEDMERLEEQLVSVKEEVEKRGVEKERLLTQLKECQKILKNNENVIAWLSKKIDTSNRIMLYQEDDQRANASD